MEGGGGGTAVAVAVDERDQVNDHDQVNAHDNVDVVGSFASSVSAAGVVVVALTLEGSSAREEPGQERVEEIATLEGVAPSLGDRVDAVAEAGEASGDAGGRVGVVA